MSSSEESAANPATGVGGMNEQQEHLTVLRMNGGVTDDAIVFVDSDQHDPRRHVLGNELTPSPAHDIGSAMSSPR